MKWSDRVRLVRHRDLLLGDVTSCLAEVHGHRRMVEEPGGLSLSFVEAAARVERMAASIAARTRPEDRVVLAPANSYDQLLACVAASRAGTIAVPVNSQMRADEIDHVVADSRAALVVRSTAELLDGQVGEPGAHRAPADWPAKADSAQVAAIFYTSGTTGKPKGVRLTHRALVGTVTAGVAWPATLRRDEAVMGLPVAHIMGFTTLLGLACAGVPVYCLPRFKAVDALNAIEQRRSTIFIGVPAMYRMLLEAGAEERDLHSIRVWGSGADVMPAELARRFQAMGAAATLPGVGVSLGNAAFVEGYGMVETGGGVAAKVSLPGPHLPSWFPHPLAGVLGIPLPPNLLKVVDDFGQEVKLGDIGELWVKGPSVLDGYHGDVAATAAVRTPEGWLRTGDLVRRRPFGLVTFAGRAKDVIKSGGYSVYAVEIERAMEEHPDVVEAAAIGMDDPRLGQVPAVACRITAGATITEDALLNWGRQCLSSYKAPRAVRIVEELPRTGTDKVAKQRLLPFFAA